MRFSGILFKALMLIQCARRENDEKWCIVIIRSLINGFYELSCDLICFKFILPCREKKVFTLFENANKAISFRYFHKFNSSLFPFHMWIVFLERLAETLNLRWQNEKVRYVGGDKQWTWHGKKSCTIRCKAGVFAKWKLSNFIAFLALFVSREKQIEILSKQITKKLSKLVLRFTRYCFVFFWESWRSFRHEIISRFCRRFSLIMQMKFFLKLRQTFKS